MLPSNEMPVARLLDSAGNPQEISVEVSGREVFASIWVASVGGSGDPEHVHAGNAPLPPYPRPPR